MALESLPQLSASFSSCRRFHSAVIQLSCSNLGRAGYKDPSLTCNASPETCFSRWLSAKPFIGSSARIFSNSISNVPCTRAEGLHMFISFTENTNRNKPSDRAQGTYDICLLDIVTIESS